MDSKVTLSFNKAIIEQAKKFAADNDISLSRLIEFLLKKVTSSEYKSLEDLPVSEWVQLLSEGKADYHIQRNRKDSKKEYFESRK